MLKHRHSNPTAAAQMPTAQSCRSNRRHHYRKHKTHTYTPTITLQRQQKQQHHQVLEAMETIIYCVSFGLVPLRVSCVEENAQMITVRHYL